MKPKLVLILLISLALAGGAGWYISRTLAAQGASMTAPSKQSAEHPTVQIVNGETVVIVRPAIQRASHIAVSPLAAVTERSYISAYATVIDLQPLYDLHDRRATAKAVCRRDDLTNRSRARSAWLLQPACPVAIASPDRNIVRSSIDRRPRRS